MKVQLTDRFCASAKSQAVQTDYFDATIPGLALRVTSGGTKSWTLLHGIPRRRQTLGRYPSMSLAAARARALEVKDGRSAGTVTALAEVYLNSIRSLRSAGEIERRLRRDVLPVIGHIPLAELHRRDVTRVIDRKINDAPIGARRVFEDVRGMLRFAVSRGDLDHNPIDGMNGPPLSKPRQRTLSDAEIKELWHGLRADNGIARVLKLCLVTGQRLGEITGMTSGELDLTNRVWNIPASRTKNGHAHSVPLTDFGLRLICDDGLHHAMDRASSSLLNGWPTRVKVSNFVLDHQLGLEHWTAHDLRRTALTKMAELGVAPIVLGHIANHRTSTKAGITLGVYVQYQYEKDKREALELWADRLQGIISGSGKVVAIHGTR
jgi:integrase